LFHKKGALFVFFIIHSIPVVAEEILIQNIATKYGS